MHVKVTFITTYILSYMLLSIGGQWPFSRIPGVSRRERRQASGKNNICLMKDNPCKGKGICKPVDDSYRCDCHSNLYEGNECDKIVQHCTQSKCQNGGTCEEAQGTFICNCPELYEGVQCEKAADGKRVRPKGHYIWYESDIYEGRNQTFLILLKNIGEDLRYEFSSGDGFKFTAIGDTFDHFKNARQLAINRGVHSEHIPAEPREIILFYYVYRKAGTYEISIKFYNHENLVMETKLPVVAYKIPNKCVPQISGISGCGSTIDSEITYFRATTIRTETQITEACLDTKLKYVWTLYERSARTSYPVTRTFLHTMAAMRETTFGPYLPAMPFIVSCTVTEVDEKNKERTHSNTALCWFRVDYRPPEALILGGSQRKVDWAKEFIVNGSMSNDIDTAPDERSMLVWTYIWTCWNSKNPEVAEKFCQGKNTKIPEKKSIVLVPANSLKANEIYIFGLVVSVGKRTSDLVEQEIIVVDTETLELELRCKKNCANLVLPLMSVIYEVICSSCEGQNISYTWDMNPGSSNKKQKIDWEKETERGRNSNLLIIPENVLLPGEVYTFTVNTHVAQLNRKGRAAVNLKMHSTPKAGTCSISPKEGVSLTTHFTVLCSGFEDNTTSANVALLYQFFQKSLIDGKEELLTLLDHDTKPVGDNILLMPGDPNKDYSSTIAIKVSKHNGMNEWYNLSVKIEPLSKSNEDLDDLEEYISELTSSSAKSIRDVLLIGNIPGAIQYITSLTEILSGIKGSEQRTADIRNNLRGKLLEILTEVTVKNPSTAKQVSTALYKVASLWEGEKPEISPTLGKKMFNVSAEMAKHAGSIILKISNMLSAGAMSQDDFYSLVDFKRIARHLMSVGESMILLNHTDKLYRVDDEWKEDSDDSTPSRRFPREKNEDYPNYKEFDDFYQDNLENFRLASYWFFEGLKEIGSTIESDLFLEEKAVELQSRNCFLCSKKFKASYLNGQKFGSTSGYSGLKISREYAESIQSGSEDVLALEVAIITTNPIWWIQASPYLPVINTEVLYVNFKNLDDKEGMKLVDSPGMLKGVEIFLALHDYEKELVEANGGSSGTAIDTDEGGDDIPVHQIQSPDGASIIISFEPPQAQEDKLMVVILKHHRPMREDFTEDTVMELPHKNSNLDKNNSFSIFVRGSFNGEDPGFPQFFYLAVMPHPNNSNSNSEFSYKFSVNNILCNHYLAKTGKWLPDGCEVGQESTFDGVHCTCSHFSLFGAAFAVAPNKMDPFSEVKLFLKVVENPVSLAVVCTILTLYILLMILARRKDLKDKRKRAVIFLKDNVPGDSHVYLLTVYTGWGKKCGTTANVSLRLQGTGGISRIHKLTANGRKVVQSSGEDWFLLLCPHSLGELLNVRIWHDSSGRDPTWYCKRVIVRELREMHVKGVWIFPVNRWIAVDRMPLASTFTGTMPCCKVRVATPAELRKWKDTFSETALLGFSDNHLWFSIFSRPVQSTFTSCQRLSIATNLLITTMMVSIMFYGVAKATPGNQLDVGVFRISVREWLVALQCLIISTLLNIPIGLIFRYSDSSDFKLYEILSRRKQHNIKEKGRLKREDNAESITMEKKNQYEAELKGEEIGTFANDSHNKNKDRRASKSFYDDDWKLPNWCRLIGWFLCIFSITLSAYFVCLYGLSYGKIKSLLWLSAVLLAVFKKTLLVQPLKILFLSFCQSYAKSLTGPDEEDLKKNPLMNESQRKELEKNLHQPKNGSQQSAPVKVSTQRNLLLRGNQPLSRNEVKILATKEVKWRETCCRALDVLALVFYIVALHIITYGACDSLAWDNANMLEKILLSGFNNLEESRPEFTSIIGNNDLYDYLNKTAIPALHASKIYGDITFDMDEGWTSHLPSKLLGIPRLRQWRTVPVPCNMSLKLGKWREDETCLPQSREIPVDNCSYGSRWSVSELVNPNDRIDKLWNCYDPDETGAQSIVGELDWYEGYGYTGDLGRNLENSRRTFQYLKDSGWIDRYTRAIILEFSMYNVDRNLFTIGYILVERSLLGTFVTSHQILTTRLIEIHFGQKMWGTVAYFIFIFATLVVLWRQCRRLYLSRVVKDSQNLNSEIYVNPDISTVPKWKRILIIVFLPTPKGTTMWSQIKGVFRNSRPEASSHTVEDDIELKGLLSKMKSLPPGNPELLSSTPVYHRYPLDPPPFIEWLLIGMTIVILFFYLMRNKAMDEPLQCLDRGVASNERHKFVSLQLGVNWDYAFKYALAVDICIATGALWCTLPSFRRLPEKTLVRTGQGPLPTMLLCFGIMLVAFGCSSHTSSLLGSSTKDFSTVPLSLSTLLGWALGVEASEEVLGVSYFGKMLYCTFGIGCSIYIINLFLTIVVEQFKKTHQEMKILKEEDEKEYSILEFWNEFRQRNIPSFKKCCKKFKKKKRGRYPGKSSQKKETGKGTFKGGEEMKKKVPSETKERHEATKEEKTNRDLMSESSEESDLNVSGKGHFSLDDYLRLRAGGQISTKFKDDCWDEIINPKTDGKEVKIRKFHHGARKFSISWLKRSREEQNSSKLAWISLEDEKNIGDIVELDEEDLNDRMNAMAAITVVLWQRGIKAKR